MTSFNLITEKLIIRDITSDDFANLKNVYNDKSVLKYLAKMAFGDDVISQRLDDMVKYRILNLQLSSAIIERRSGKFIGFTRVDLFPSFAYLQMHNMQIKSIVEDLGPGGHFQSAYLLEDYQNKGYMTEVMYLLTDYLVKNGVRYLFGTVNHKNMAAKKLLDKFGFKYIFTAPVDLQPLGIPFNLTKFNDEYLAISELK